jgi:hypothetical protein
LIKEQMMIKVVNEVSLVARESVLLKGEEKPEDEV